MSDVIKNRILIRLKKSCEETLDEYYIDELQTTISDRLCLRLGVDKLPESFSSICVDATVKMYRRTYYEGVESENEDGIITSFIENVLSEYDEEISAYLSKNNMSRKTIRFI